MRFIHFVIVFCLLSVAIEYGTSYSEAANPASSRKVSKIYRAAPPRKSTPSKTKAIVRSKQRAIVAPNISYVLKQVQDPELLDRARLSFKPGTMPVLESLPNLDSVFLDRVALRSDSGDYVFLSIDPGLQEYVRKVVTQSRATHVAAVVMDPHSGRILAMAEHSLSLPHPSMHGSYPAASLFKVVTASAAMETAGVTPDEIIHFRGGTYSLTPWNISPDGRRDRRYMTLTEALGKSCNPVFARVALRFLKPTVLRSYAEKFGFNGQLGFDVRLSPSSATIPDDDYEFGRAAAGFGAVTVSPVHAATLMSAVANSGVMPQPYIIDSVISPGAVVKFRKKARMLRQTVDPATARAMLEMMEATTTNGTARKAFFPQRHAELPGISVAAKTGTLSGEDPKGINNWFIAAAPKESPRVAIAVIVVYSEGVSAKASTLGKQILQRYFEIPERRPQLIQSLKRKKKR